MWRASYKFILQSVRTQILVQFAFVLRLSYYLGLHLSIIYVDKPAAQHTEIFSKIFTSRYIYIY